jgi:nitrogen-specific signal transduction histidine kinase
VFFENYAQGLDSYYEVTAYCPSPGQFACIFQDITSRKRAEEENQKLEAQLQQSLKMEAIGTLSGGIAHDFNNILGVIVGNTDLALMDVPEWNHAHGNLQEIQKASMRARDMVRQILAFSRRSESKMGSIAINLIVKESLKMLRSSIPTTIEIRQDVTADIDTINGDPTQINQVLLNLCTNAAHAMKEGGTLEVNLDNTRIEEDETEVYPDLEPGDYVRLKVGDTGHGIEPEDMEKIFDPYFTTKGVGEGSGMGLSMVHGIVKNHAGTITVNSEVGKGTVFEALFPIIKGKPESETVSEGALPKGDERILFVDDEPSMVATYKAMLERLGYTVNVRTSSIEALEAFKAQPGKYDLIITDQTMPHLTGQMMAKEMMTIRPDIPIILCTGHSALINEDTAIEMGIRAFVMKPIVMGEIAKTIREVLD